MVLIKLGSLMLIVFGPIRTAVPYLRCHFKFFPWTLPDKAAKARCASVNLADKGPGNAFNGENKSSQVIFTARRNPIPDSTWAKLSSGKTMINADCSMTGKFAQSEERDLREMRGGIREQISQITRPNYATSSNRILICIQAFNTTATRCNNAGALTLLPLSIGVPHQSAADYYYSSFSRWGNLVDKSNRRSTYKLLARNITVGLATLHCEIGSHFVADHWLPKKYSAVVCTTTDP